MCKCYYKMPERHMTLKEQLEGVESEVHATILHESFVSIAIGCL